MKILQIIQKPQRRGAEIFASQLSEHFRQKGHQVRKIYLYPSPSLNALPLQDGDVVIGTDENHFSEKFPGWNPRILKKLQSTVSEFMPDVIQINAARTVKYGALLRWKDPHSSWILIYRNIGDPSVWLQSRWRKWIFRLLVLSRVDGMVAVSSASFEMLKSRNSISCRIVQIPRGVDSETFKPRRSREEVRKKLATPASTNVLISVGSLSAEKRLDRLLRVFQSLVAKSDDLRLWIVGDGSLRSAMEHYAHELRVSSCVQFLGSQEDVASLYNAADLHILTSDTEGIPGVVLEAALVGVPTVATRVGGVTDCILNLETGVVVDPEKEDELASAVDCLLRNHEKRTAMGERARNWVLQKFSLEKITGAYLAFYEKLLKNRSIIDAKIPNHESAEATLNADL